VDTVIDIEHHSLELRYQGLRVRSPQAERRLLASLSERGQLVPVIVVPGEAPARFVLIDGYARVRSLKRLGCDTVRAVVWAMGEAEALLLVRSLRVARGETALEQGWLLAELIHRFGVPQEELRGLIAARAGCRAGSDW
jgi:ParB-like chromosome segregation protein Spo0J